MKILVLGDVHYDLWRRSSRGALAVAAPEIRGLDALILIGDLAGSPERGWPDLFEYLRGLIDPARIWVMPGNHDYYGFRLDGDDRLQELAERAGANFLQKSALELGGVRFLACTLWSDFWLRGKGMREQDMVTAARAMNDYLQIRTCAGGPVARPADTAAIFEDHRGWLSERLDEPYSGRTVVLTHHSPSPGAVGKIDEVTPAFCSDLDDLILEAEPDLWLFGHTHRHLEATVGRTRLRNVSLGYPKEVDLWRHHEIIMAGPMDTELPGLLARE